ncbi:hypothetical protein V6N13_142529 [Hibiscus sabdariffa]
MAMRQAEILEVSRLGSSPPQGVGDGDHVVWEHNSAFEQGALDTIFIRSFLGSDYNPKDDILFRGNRLVDECIQGAANKFQTSPSLSSTGLVASILRLTEYDWELVIRHVPRKGNALADRLSKWGRIHSPETVILVHPPLTLNALVNAEKGSGLRDPLLVQDWLRDATATCFNLRADPGG